MSEINQIIDSLIKFRNERDWDQFHNPKDLALAINVEAGELLLPGFCCVKPAIVHITNTKSKQFFFI